MIEAQVHAPSRWRDPFDPPAWGKRIVWFCRAKLDPKHPFVGALKGALLQGDPLADDVVAWMESTERGEGRRMLDRALERGIDAVPDAPEPLVRLFAQLDRVPEWVDRHVLRYGCETIQRAGFLNDYALGSGSLMSGYLSSAAVKPLMCTGALVDNASRRVAETGKFVLDITESGDLGRFTDGFRTTVRVRMLHATIRAKLRRSPAWKTEEWGLPINQHDLLGTNLQFSMTYMLALRIFGFLLSRREREAIMHFWRYVGYLVGVEPSLLPKTYREGIRCLRLLGTSQPDPDEDSRRLAAALIDVSVGSRSERRARFDRSLRAGLSRSFMGDAAADALGLPDEFWKYAVLGLSPAVMATELVRRAVPGGRAVAVRIGRRYMRGQIRTALLRSESRRMHV